MPAGQIDQSMRKPSDDLLGSRVVARPKSVDHVDKRRSLHGRFRIFGNTQLSDNRHFLASRPIILAPDSGPEGIYLIVAPFWLSGGVRCRPDFVGFSRGFGKLKAE